MGDQNDYLNMAMLGAGLSPEDKVNLYGDARKMSADAMLHPADASAASEQSFDSDRASLNADRINDGKPGPAPTDTGFQAQPVDPTSAAIAKMGDMWRARTQAPLSDDDINSILAGKNSTAIPDYLATLLNGPTSNDRSPASDDDSDDSSSGASAKAGSPASAAGQAMAQATAGKKPYDPKAELAKFYGADLNDDALKAAQQSRNQQQMLAALSSAGAQAGAALSRGAIKADTSLQDKLMQEAGNGVNDILQRRQGKMQELEAGLKLSDFQDKTQLRDENSPISAAYRSMALQLNPKLKNMPNFSHLDAESIKQLEPMVDMSMKMQMMNLQKAQMFQYKQTMDQAKAKSEMATKIGTSLNRGAPSKAMDVDRRVDNVMDLINDPRWAGNLDKMPPNQVNALTDEMAQIFTGGMSTEGKAAGLMHPTLASGLAKLWESTSGHPSGAQMGEFIEQYKPYLQALQQNSRHYVADQINPVLTGYNKRVAPGDMDEMKTKYDKYLSAKAGNQGSAASGPHGPTVIQNGHTYTWNPETKQYE